MTKNNRFDDVEKILEIANDKEKRSVIKSLMTKYELDNVLNQRTIQLAQGAYTFVSKIEIDGKEQNINEMKVKTNMELRKIAIEELKEGKMPLMVKRSYPNGKVDYIKMKDMDLTAVRDLIH
tara:strand:+ start:320 stop:685 length:366 start_codon:yes stop_codon:yes gene_type:complete